MIVSYVGKMYVKAFLFLLTSTSPIVINANSESAIIVVENLSFGGVKRYQIRVSSIKYS